MGRKTKGSKLENHLLVDNNMERKLPSVMNHQLVEIRNTLTLKKHTPQTSSLECATFLAMLPMGCHGPTNQVLYRGSLKSIVTIYHVTRNINPIDGELVKGVNLHNERRDIHGSEYGFEFKSVRWSNQK